MPGVFLERYLIASSGEHSWVARKPEGRSVFIQSPLDLVCFEFRMLPIKSNHNLNCQKKKSLLVSKHTRDKIQNPLQGPIGLGSWVGAHEQEALASVA